jgi:hypothetical protein
MKLLHGVLVVAVLGCAAAAVWWRASSGPAVPGPAPAAPAEAASTRAGEAADGRAPGGRAETVARDSAAPVAPTAGVHAAAVPRAASASETGAGRLWPVRTGRTAGAAAVGTAEPAVPVELAFKALQYVGVDPEAEKTWQRAIDDPNMPAGVRSDLIEDLNQEGYADNSHPTKSDLPLIRARLELIERLAPLAKDAVNAAAFAEAYKDLLEMYVRLGGEQRTGR